ncbi:hypothetical protein [Azospirillum sp. Marseille-Q6669]
MRLLVGPDLHGMADLHREDPVRGHRVGDEGRPTAARPARPAAQPPAPAPPATNTSRTAAAASAGSQRRTAGRPARP